NCESPVGTGPFQVESWDREQQINLVRNEYCVSPVDTDGEEVAYLDGITWRMIPEAATRYAALQSGEVHVIDNAQPESIQTAEDGNIGQLDSPRPGASNRVELNSSQAPFDYVLVREAFIRAVHVDGGVEAFFFNTAPRSHALLSTVEPLGYS